MRDRCFISVVKYSLLSVFFIVINLSISEKVQFVSPRANYITFGVVLFFPMISLALSLRQSQRTKKKKITTENILMLFPALFSGLILLLWLFLVLFWTPDIILHDIDKSFHKTESFVVNEFVVSKYTINHGALSDFQYVVRIEKEILPGVIYVVKRFDMSDLCSCQENCVFRDINIKDIACN